MKKYEELENKVKELQEEIERLKKAEKSGRWKPDKDTKYYFIDQDGEIERTFLYDDKYSIDRYQTRNCFKTEEDAQRYKELREIHYQIMDIADELGRPTEEDLLNDYLIKHTLIYNNMNKKIETYYCFSSVFSTICCLDVNFKKVCIERIGKDKLKDYLMNWER